MPVPVPRQNAVRLKPTPFPVFVPFFKEFYKNGKIPGFFRCSVIFEGFPG